MRAAGGAGSDLLGQRDPEREPSHDLVLSMPALLGIFVTVALVCAVCFGFGYSSSRSTAPQQHLSAAAPTPVASLPTPSTASTEDEPETADNPQGRAQDSAAEQAYPTPTPEKPAPGTTVASPDLPPDAEHSAPALSSRDAATAQAPPQNYAGQLPARGGAPLAPQTAAVPAPRTAPLPTASELPPPAAPIGSGMMVQIAAVTRAADAQTLANALRHDGFDAIVRTSTGDPYFHVQVGPFSSMDAARAMRTKLADNGYNAFIKP